MPIQRMLVIAAALALAHCGAPPSVPSPDGGSSADGSADAMIARDASTSGDSGVSSDSAAPPSDGGASDAGASSDSGATAECIGRPAQCAFGTNGGACGDTLSPPACEAGVWTCGAGMVFVSSCACIGRPPGANCTCASSGWRCDDAGLARRFACGGALTCLGGAEYCSETIPGVPGAARQYACRALPMSCGATPTCECLALSGGMRCAQSSEGDLTVTTFAP